MPRVFLLLVAGMDYDTAVIKGVRSPGEGQPGHIWEQARPPL